MSTTLVTLRERLRRITSVTSGEDSWLDGLLIDASTQFAEDVAGIVTAAYSITLVAATDEYDLASEIPGFLRLETIRLSPASGQTVGEDVSIVSPQQLEQLKQVSTASPMLTAAILGEDRLLVHPAPGVGESRTLEGEAAVTGTAMVVGSDSDVCPIPDAWVNAVVDHAAHRALFEDRQEGHGAFLESYDRSVMRARKSLKRRQPRAVALRPAGATGHGYVDPLKHMGGA